jgi:hypothetical protein
MGVSKASLRGLRIDKRIEKIREQANKAHRPTVKVTPKNDTLRKLLRHPRAGGFRAEGSAEWPDDRFTQRRVKDGDVTVEKAEPENHEHRGGGRHRRHDEPSAA